MTKRMAVVIAGALLTVIGCATGGGGSAPATTPTAAPGSPDMGAPSGGTPPAAPTEQPR